MPLPTLTFTQTARQSPAAATKQAQRDALKAAVNTLLGAQGWSAVDAATADDVNLPGARIISPGGSPVTCQFIVGWGDGTSPASGQMQTPDGLQANNVPMIFMGGSYTAGNNWYAASPFGAGVRTSKGWVLAPSGNVSLDSRWWAVASEETIGLFCRAGITDTEIYGGYGGAVVEPANAASREADGRIYGMFAAGRKASSGNLPFRSDLHTQSSNEGFFRNHPTTDGQTHAGFFGPASPGVWSGSQTAWQFMGARGFGFYAEGAAAHHTEDGKPWPSEIEVFRVNSINVSLSKLGALRGVRIVSDEICRRIIRDGGVNKEIILSGSLAAQVDAFSFRAG